MLLTEAQFEAHVRKAGRALVRLDGSGGVEVVSQIERRVIALAPLEPAMRTELEWHPERPGERQHDLLGKEDEHAGSRIRRMGDYEGARDRAERHAVENRER